MSISAISSTAAGSNLSANNLGVQDFMKILLTQLTYQDPLKPMDNEQFMAQMAQFTALQQTQDANAKLDQLIGNQAALQSVGLLGRQVDISTAGGQLTGTVSGLSLSGSAPTISVNALTGEKLSDISLGQIIAVR